MRTETSRRSYEFASAIFSWCHGAAPRNLFQISAEGRKVRSGSGMAYADCPRGLENGFDPAGPHVLPLFVTTRGARGACDARECRREALTGMLVELGGVQRRAR